MEKNIIESLLKNFDYRKEKTRNYLFLGIFIVILILSGYYLNKGEELPTDTIYRYQIIPYGDSDEIIVKNLTFSHYFSNNLEEIEFSIRKRDYLENPKIRFAFPLNISKKDITIYYYENGTKKELNKGSLEMDEIDNGFLIKLKKPSSEEDQYIIFIKNIKIIPSGGFWYYMPTNGLETIHGTSIINLILGKNYICSYSCIVEGHRDNIDQTIIDDPKRLSLNIKKNNEFVHFFIRAKRDESISQGIWIGLFSSTIVSILLLIKEILDIKFNKG